MNITLPLGVGDVASDNTKLIQSSASVTAVMATSGTMIHQY